ncbi:DUF5655 domain-containing protein [Algoriphagus namhaensis]
MDPGQKMIENLETNTGKSLEQWVQLVQQQNLIKHGQILSYLKSEHGFTHGFANLVAHKALKSDAGSQEDPDLMELQYRGKEHFKPVFEKLKSRIQAFGEDVEFVPKKAYVSVKRKKQFAMLIPATKTRFEIGINLKGQEPKGILEADTKTNGMCSHKIHLEAVEDLNEEVFDWLKSAYEVAG